MEVFIASSGKESEFVTELAKFLNCASRADDPTRSWQLKFRTWFSSGMFTPGMPTLEAIENHLFACRFGIFVFTPDENSLPNSGASDSAQPATATFVPRDNVIFEYGLWLARYGAAHAIALVCGDVNLPSDNSSVTVIRYKKGESISKIAQDIIDHIVGLAFGMDITEQQFHIGNSMDSYSGKTVNSLIEAIRSDFTTVPNRYKFADPTIGLKDKASLKAASVNIPTADQEKLLVNQTRISTYFSITDGTNMLYLERSNTRETHLVTTDATFDAWGWVPYFGAFSLKAKLGDKAYDAFTSSTIVHVTSIPGLAVEDNARLAGERIGGKGYQFKTRNETVVMVGYQIQLSQPDYTRVHEASVPAVESGGAGKTEKSASKSANVHSAQICDLLRNHQGQTSKLQLSVQFARDYFKPPCPENSKTAS